MDDWNRKDKEAFLTNFTENSEITGPGGIVLQGLAAIEMFWDIWQTAFPDNQTTISNVFSAGDQGCREGVLAGTHTGILQGPDGSQIPPTGRYLRLPFAEFATACDGRFVTTHFYFDQLDMLTQLGQIPTSASAV